MENHDRGQGTPGVPDVLSGKGGTVEMPREEVPGETGDEDGDAGTLCAPACPLHRDDTRGRKLPSPTVRQVRHASPPNGAEWAPPGDRAVCKNGVEKEMAAGRDGDKEELGAGFQSLRGTHRVSDEVQVTREDLDGDRQPLAGGGWVSQEGEAKLGIDGKGA